MTVEESILGARNRALAAIQRDNSDYGIGLESGVEKIGEKWFVSCWCVVINKEGKEGIGSSARLELSEKIMKYLLEGIELADSMGILTGRNDVKYTDGVMGILTNGVLPRDRTIEQGIIFAFAPFISDEKFW